MKYFAIFQLLQNIKTKKDTNLNFLKKTIFNISLIFMDFRWKQDKILSDTMKLEGKYKGVEKRY